MAAARDRSSVPRVAERRLHDGRVPDGAGQPGRPRASQGVGIGNVYVTGQVSANAFKISYFLATPTKAHAFKAELLVAYENCGFPGDGFSTDPPGLILPACTPVRSDPTCQFEASGSGKILAKVASNKTTGLKDDIAIKATIKKLTAGCIGQTLTAVASANATSEDCSNSTAGESCTVVNDLIVNFNIGNCVVATNGLCRISTTVNKFANGTVIEGGNRLSLEIRDTRIKRGTHTTFTPGLLVP